jgi:CRISPR-associated protein Csm5
MNGSTVQRRFVIDVLAPTHVGSGRDALVEDVDYVVRDRVHVIDQERLFEQLDEGQLRLAEQAASLSRLLAPGEEQRFERYSLELPTRDRVPRILEQSRDATGRPYLPGSSLKGAIRTALAWAQLSASGAPFGQNEAGFNPRFADDPLMRRVFGRTPNHDLLRALLPADSTPGAEGGPARSLARVVVYSLSGMPGVLRPKGERWAFFVETLAPGTRLELTVRVDTFLLERRAARALGFDGQQELVHNWPAYCAALGRAIIARERDFYAAHDVPELAAFYEALDAQAAAAQAEGGCVMQLAWGAGWLGKTVGTALTDDALADFRAAFRLGRRGYPAFPKSRRLVERAGKPVMPLGWLRLRPAGEGRMAPPAVAETIAAPAVQPAPEATRSPARPPKTIGELQPGMELQGIVTRLTEYAAFVNIGVGRDGFLHISKLGLRRGASISDALRVGQRITVIVETVDLEQRRIALRWHR